MAKTAVLKPFLAIATDKMKAKTVAELQARTEFKEGDVVEVLGELVAGDGKHHMRIASKVADASGVQGQGGLFWNVVPNSPISLIAQAIEQNKTDITTVDAKANQNKSDILSKVPLDRLVNQGNGSPDWSKRPIPAIGIDGVMDIGRYIDFHETSNDNVDHSIRIYSTNGRFEIIEGGSGHNGRLTGDISKTGTGWCKLANGLIIQWGYVLMPAGSTSKVDFTFPIVFTMEKPIMTVSTDRHMSYTGMPIVQCAGTSRAGGSVQCGGGIWNATVNEVIYDHLAMWIAIGY